MQLRDESFSQVTKELGLDYGILRRLLERGTDKEALGFIRDENRIYLGIDEHSFKHQVMVYTIMKLSREGYWEFLKTNA